jgi:CBS-domain-containing membrane protein
MLVAEALNTDTRVLTASDMISDALERMDELGVETLPVIDQTSRELLGQISRSALLQPGTEVERPVADLSLEKPIAIFNNQHLFHAVRLMLQHELRVLPVVDEAWIFKGTIRKNQLLEALGQMLNLTGYGSVIIIELGQQDFSLAEIVQLIETEGGKILGITVETPDADKKAYEVSVKLNLQDVSRVASALRRYGYTILTDVKSEAQNIDLETRADQLLRYLDM